MTPATPGGPATIRSGRRDFQEALAEVAGRLDRLDDPTIRAGIGELASQLAVAAERIDVADPGFTSNATDLLREVGAALRAVRDELAAMTAAVADGQDVVFVIDSVSGRRLAGLPAEGDPGLPDVVFAAGTPFRVTDVREAADDQPAVVWLTEVGPAGVAAAMAAAPVVIDGGPAGDLRDPLAGGRSRTGL
jgi:hypothetical protein